MFSCRECGNQQWGEVRYPQLFDGVLFWVCLVCQVAKPRCLDTRHLRRASRVYADEHNRLLDVDRVSLTAINRDEME